jgi:hypothetical protein
MAKIIAFVLLCASVMLFLGGWGAIIYGLILWSWPLSLKVCLIGAAMYPLSWLTFFASIVTANIVTANIDD